MGRFTEKSAARQASPKRKRRKAAALPEGARLARIFAAAVRVMAVIEFQRRLLRGFCAGAKTGIRDLGHAHWHY
ncbi:MAG: hypothetical protein WB680_00875 [Candidatus Acidiferrales bacterium]